MLLYIVYNVTMIMMFDPWQVHNSGPLGGLYMNYMKFIFKVENTFICISFMH
jgi:hypothetical protein